MISLFDFGGEIFQLETPLMAGVTREVWKIININ